MKLEEFVQKNRDAFDAHEASPRVWQNIRRALGHAPRRSVVFWRAAAIVLFGVAAFALGRQWPPARNSPQAIEFSELERFYAAEIDEKAALIRSFPVSAYQDPFQQELQKLEAMYLVLKEEMRRRPAPTVKDALVLNMLVRIDLLNLQLEQLEAASADSVRRPPTVGT